MHLLRSKLLVGATRVALAKGDNNLAANLLQEARTFTEERGMRDLYPLITFTNAQLLTTRGEVDDALEQYDLAEASALEMNMRPMVWQALSAAGPILSTKNAARPRSPSTRWESWLTTKHCAHNSSKVTHKKLGEPSWALRSRAIVYASISDQTESLSDWMIGRTKFDLTPQQSLPISWLRP